MKQDEYSSDTPIEYDWSGPELGSYSDEEAGIGNDEALSAGQPETYDENGVNYESAQGRSNIYTEDDLKAMTDSSPLPSKPVSDFATKDVGYSGPGRVYSDGTPYEEDDELYGLSGQSFQPDGSGPAGAYPPSCPDQGAQGYGYPSMDSPAYSPNQDFQDTADPSYGTDAPIAADPSYGTDAHDAASPMYGQDAPSPDAYPADNAYDGSGYSPDGSAGASPYPDSSAYPPSDGTAYTPDGTQDGYGSESAYTPQEGYGESPAGAYPYQDGGTDYGNGQDYQAGAPEGNGEDAGYQDPGYGNAQGIDYGGGQEIDYGSAGQQDGGYDYGQQESAYEDAQGYAGNPGADGSGTEQGGGYYQDSPQGETYPDTQGGQEYPDGAGGYQDTQGYAGQSGYSQGSGYGSNGYADNTGYAGSPGYADNTGYGNGGYADSGYAGTGYAGSSGTEDAQAEPYGQTPDYDSYPEAKVHKKKVRNPVYSEDAQADLEGKEAKLSRRKEEKAAKRREEKAAKRAEEKPEVVYVNGTGRPTLLRSNPCAGWAVLFSLAGLVATLYGYWEVGAVGALLGGIGIFLPKRYKSGSVFGLVVGLAAIGIFLAGQSGRIDVPKYRDFVTEKATEVKDLFMGAVNKVKSNSDTSNGPADTSSAVHAEGDPIHVDYSGIEISNVTLGYDGQYVTIYYDFTNKTGQDAIPAKVVNARAYQGGILLTAVDGKGDEMCENEVKTVMAGSTVTVGRKFEVGNIGTDIIVKMGAAGIEESDQSHTYSILQSPPTASTDGAAATG